MKKIISKYFNNNKTGMLVNLNLADTIPKLVMACPDKKVPVKDFLTFVYSSCKTRGYVKCDPHLMWHALMVATREVSIDSRMGEAEYIICHPEDAEWINTADIWRRYTIEEHESCEKGNLIIFQRGTTPENAPFLQKGSNLLYSKDSLKRIQTITFS